MTERPDQRPGPPGPGTPADHAQDPAHSADTSDTSDTGAEALDAALLADLRQAWNELPVPDASPELDAADPLTRAAVAWMRDAYAAQQPNQLGPSLPARQRWRQGWRRWQRPAVAAVLLLGLGLAVAQWPDANRRPSRDSSLDGVLAAGGPVDSSTDDSAPDSAAHDHTPLAPRQPSQPLADRAAPASAAQAPADRGDTPGVAQPTPRDPHEPRLVAVADDHIALRAGSVRLVLITSPASAE